MGLHGCSPRRKVAILQFLVVCFSKNAVTVSESLANFSGERALGLEDLEALLRKAFLK